MSRFQLGVVVESLGLPVRPAIQEAARMGAEGVQIDALGDLAPDRLGETGRREFKNLLRSFNLQLTALGCPLRRGLDSAENLQPRIEHVQKVLQLAYDLGARKVVVPCPKLPTDAASPRAVTLRESLSALAATADRVGSELGLEAGLDPGDKLRDYLGTYDSGSLRVNFDPANFLMNGFDPLASLSALAGRVAHTHARDARTATVSGGPKEVPVGAGDIEWMVYVATLESVGYSGFLTVERESGENRLADVRNGLTFLRRFVGPTGG